jgi:hypothetical protein
VGRKLWVLDKNKKVGRRFQIGNKGYRLCNLIKQSGATGGSTYQRIVYHAIKMKMGVLLIAHWILIHGGKSIDKA